ncbi:hypothetical protein LCGC14_1323160 [marine sediment metagenome]|uniref:Mannose-6-phosphate isomerase type II C-terminal domain-containing protein n=1 Tax=marine sediment metagenome TaxID=412755 RepID=A0A0F9L4C7_9ZZZZ
MKIIDKPWGREISLFDNGHVRAKIIEINPGQKLSLQYHNKKIEFLAWIDGSGEIILGNKKRAYNKDTDNKGVMIFPKTRHRFMSTKTEKVRYLELSVGSDLDIIRIEDNYGRINE